MTTESINFPEKRSAIDAAIAETAVAFTSESTALVVDDQPLPLLTQRLPSHIPTLDGIRGLAVLMVLFCHGILRPYGDDANAFYTGIFDRSLLGLGRFAFTGVDLFFVLSGFLITGILFDAKGKSHFFRNFYARRTVRIFPLYYVTLVIMFVIWPRLPAWWSEGLGHLESPQAWYWFYLSNYAQAYTEQIGRPTHHVMHVSWSLSIEEQFYLCWPMVVFLFDRRTLLKIAVGMFFGSIVIRTGFLAMGLTYWGVGFTPCRLDGLGTGAAIALIARGPRGLRSLIKPAWIIAPIAAVLVAAVMVIMQKLGYRLGIAQSPGYVIAGPALVALMFGSILVLAATSIKGSRFNWFFAHPVLRMLGKYSYAIYLFHLPIMAFVAAHWFRPDYWKVGPTMLPGMIVFWAITWTMSILAALISWNFMEKHFLKLKDYFPLEGSHHAPAKAATA